MKHLFLLRHAKSSWGDASLSDFARPLNERGLDAAPRVGRELAARGALPDFVLASPAVRARATAELALAAANFDVSIKFDERIYAASVGRLFEVLSEIDDAYTTVMLVGHNPGMEELLAHFTGELRPVPTAACARLTLDVDGWRQIHEARAQLDWFIKPRELNA